MIYQSITPLSNTKPTSDPSCFIFFSISFPFYKLFSVNKDATDDAIDNTSSYFVCDVDYNSVMVVVMMKMIWFTFLIRYDGNDDGGVDDSVVSIRTD